MVLGSGEPAGAASLGASPLASHHPQQRRPTNGPSASAAGAPARKPCPARYLALDTNVLLDHLPLVRTLHARMLTGDTWLLVPATVITELDGLKTSPAPLQGSASGDRIGDAARRATAWLLDTVRAQRRGGAGRVRLERWSDAAAKRCAPGSAAAQVPDNTILACCLHFSEVGAGAALGGREGEPVVTLWTNDRNLALSAETNGIPTLGGRVGMGQLCAAAGVIGVAEMEAMDVDGEVAALDDHDLPLFSRRRHPISQQVQRHQRDRHQRAAHIHGAASAPGGDGVTYSAELPPPDALRTALAELMATSPEKWGAPVLAPVPVPPAPRRRSWGDPSWNPTITTTTTASEASPTLSTSPSMSISPTFPTSPLFPASPTFPNSFSTSSASTQVPSTSASTATSLFPSSVSASTSRGRILTPQLSAALSTILGRACTGVASNSLPPVADTAPTALASTLAAGLAALTRTLPGNSDFVRPVARAADAARTLAAWLDPVSAAQGGGGRRVRSGQAADAVRVLCAELGGLGVELDVGTWEGVAVLVRDS